MTVNIVVASHSTPECETEEIIMKKKVFWGLLLTVLCMVLLTGCGKNPKSVVGKFCDGMKTLDYAKMNECLLNPDDQLKDPFAGEDEELEVFTAFIKEQSGNIKYEIVDANTDGEDATVNVKFTYTDASPVITSAMAEYFTQGIGMAFAGASEEQMSNLLLTIFQQKLQETTLSTTDSTVAIKCKKSDGDWKVTEVSDDVANVMTCNILKAFERVGDSFGGDSSSSTESSSSSDITVVNETDKGDEEEKIVYTDIPMGQEVQLATIKLTVLDCKETDKLTNDYSESVAPEGSKYIVFTVKVENTTKNPSEFSASDLPLQDNQGRTFMYDSDATFSLDDYLLYRETNPNMPETGSFVYNVPVDTEGYGFCAANADTGEYLRFMGQ